MKVHVFLVISLCLLTAPLASAEELGPRSLRGRTVAVRNNTRNIHAGIFREARSYVNANAVRMNRDRTFPELVGRWVPGAGELSGGARVAINRGALSRPEATMLVNYANQMAGAAQALQNAGLRGEAGAEAYRALALDSTIAGAGILLGYQTAGRTYTHPAAAALANRRMALTSFGWLPTNIASQQRSGYAPDVGMWQPIGIVDARHSTWAQRHVLTFTFIRIETTLSLNQIYPWARDVDALMGWLRARFIGIQGYREPAWPLVLRIYQNSAECRMGGDAVPQAGAYWKNGGVIDYSTVSRNRLQIKNLAQMVLAEGFLESAFRHGRRGAIVSGWMDGGFGKWAYYSDMASPNRTRFWDSARSSLSNVLREINLNRDLFGQLRGMTYEQGRRHEYARAAPLLIDICTGDPLAWEGVARFLSKVAGATEKRVDFEQSLGTTAIVSAAVNGWVRSMSGTQPPGGGGGTTPGQGQPRTLTVGEAFLRHLGVDVSALTSAVGVTKARQIARDVLHAYLQSETSAGKPGALVRFTLRDVPGRSEWTVEFSGRRSRVQALIDAILWRAGLRPPPKPVEDAAPPPVQPPVQLPDPGPGTGFPSWNPPPDSGSALPPQPPAGGRIFDQPTAAWARRLFAGNREVTPQTLAVIDRGDSAAMQTLVGLLDKGSPQTRSSVVLLMGRIGPASPLAMGGLKKALKDSDKDIRITTLGAYRTMGAKAEPAVPDIAAVMVSDREWTVRRQAANTLEVMPAKSLKPVLPTLLTGLRDKDSRVRDANLKVLEKVAEEYPDTRSQIRLAVMTSGGAEGLINELLKRLGD